MSGEESRGSEWFRDQGADNGFAIPYTLFSDKVVYIRLQFRRFADWIPRLNGDIVSSWTESVHTFFVRLHFLTACPDNMIHLSCIDTLLNCVPRYQDMSKQLKTSLLATACWTMLTCCRSTRSLLLVLCQRRSWTIGTSPWIVGKECHQRISASLLQKREHAWTC